MKSFGGKRVEQLAVRVSGKAVMACRTMADGIHMPAQERDSWNVTSQLLHMVSESDMNLFLWAGVEDGASRDFQPLVFLRTTTSKSHL